MRGEELTAEQLQERPSASLPLPGHWGKGDILWDGLGKQWGLNNSDGAAALFLLNLHQKIPGWRGFALWTTVGEPGWPWVLWGVPSPESW